MFRKLCGRVKCNNSPTKRTRVNNVKNYVKGFDPNSIKMMNERGLGPAIEIGPSNATFNWGGTNNKFRGQNIGRILRALLTKAVINKGKYNKINHKGANMGGRSRARQGGNARPTSTWILQEQLGFRPNPVAPNSISEFRRGNNTSRINKTLNNYKKGAIGPKTRKQRNI